MSNSGKVWDIREAYKLERNNAWTTNKGDRGIFCGGGDPNSNVIEFFAISSQGNPVDFGDLSTTRPGCTGSSNAVKAIVAGASSYASSADVFTIATTGNATEFGDLSQGRVYAAGYGNNTRGVVHCGLKAPGAVTNRIDAVNYASLGNYADFGDSTQARRDAPVGFSNGIRGLAAGGSTPGVVDTIDFTTIAIMANAIDFGDLATATSYGGGASNSIKGCFAGGYAPTRTDKIEYITIATTGNGVDQGNLTAGVTSTSVVANETRAITGGGYGPSSAVTTMDAIILATNANATDFGDITVARQLMAQNISNSHGGILPEEQRPSVTYMPGSGRGLIVGGEDGPGNNLTNVEALTITTLGNSFDFGDMDVASRDHAAISSLTRLLKGGSSSPALSDAIGSIEMQSLGNGSDFGNLTEARRNLGGFSNTTRGLFAGGSGAPDGNTMKNIIDYVTIASVGNATDFGDLTSARRCSNSGAGSSTRAIFSGGTTPGTSDYVNTIDYVTTASTGNATDFGDLTVARSYGSALSSSTRAIYCAGQTPSASNVIDYVTTASTGNATDFGDSTVARTNMARLSNSSRGVFASGYVSPGMQNVIDYITIGSTGNAIDFGDVTTARSTDGQSDSHGGLQA